ncbi:hypothetical protein LCGC14_0235350 [marine sediment metagenome]|uniref:Uncharacterized protein n=1 Tax=marine sediment metagenome TaxID=412755 RepID=A0A0F9UDE4_9ZZZZ
MSHDNRLCPRCEALAVMFSDHEVNNTTGMGLRCANRCGWILTMKDVQKRLDDAIESLRWLVHLHSGVSKSGGKPNSDEWAEAISVACSELNRAE